MWQVHGHEPVVRFLQQSMADGRLSQAYLLVGPPNIGKTTLALQLAAAVNCAHDDPPCGVCVSCAKVARGIHPDVRLIEPEENALKLAQVRELQREAALSPYEGAWRVFILTDFAKATPEAANALLKTLEEPPPQVILILTATDVAALLPTVVSRCRVLHLRPLSTDKVVAILRQEKLAPDEAELIARLSQGRIGWALELAQQRGQLAERGNRLNALRNVARQGIVPRMDFAQEAAKDATAARELLDLWLLWWRDLLLVQMGCPELVVNLDQMAALQRDAPAYEATDVRRFIRLIQRIRSDLDKNANVRLAVEALVLETPHPSAAVRAEAGDAPAETSISPF